jgi:hypothetical protein
VQHRDAARIAREAGARGIKIDARGEVLRICPDILNSAYDLERAARTLSDLMHA